MTPDDMQDQVEALNRLAREEAGALVDKIGRASCRERV